MTPAKTATLNEWRILWRHPLIWVVIIGATMFSAVVVRGAPTDPAEGAAVALKWLNLFLPMFVLPFAAGSLAPIFYLRELDNDMAEVLGAYPVTPRAWLVMRVGSFFLLLFSVCLMAEASFIAMLQTDFPGQFPAMIARGAGWLLLLHAPACLVWASTLAWIACRRANSGLLYFTAGIGWLAYLALAALTGSPMIAGSFAPWPLLKQITLVLDPYAATALLSPMPQTGPLQWREANVAVGRLIWLLACWLVLRGIRSVPTHAGRKPERQRTSRAGAATRTVGPLGLHLRFVVRDRVFPLLVLGWLVLLLPEVLGGMDYVEPLARLHPDSRDALNRVVWDIVIGAGSILLFYSADRICRLFSATRMHELYAATPHRPRALVTAQFAGLVLVAVFFALLAVVAVLAAQMLAGSPVQPDEYAKQLGLALSRLTVTGMLFVALHGLLRQRYLANLACLLLVVVGLSSLAPTIGLHHPLWRPVGSPLTMPDHLWGFGGSLTGHWLFISFWATIGTAMLLLAIAIHHRTAPFPQLRLRDALRQTPAIVALVLLTGAVAQGFRIDHALRKEGALITNDDRNQWRADYERRYATWQFVAQPQVEAIRSRVDFFPRDNRVRLEAQIGLANHSDEPISSLLVGRNVRDHGMGRIWLDKAIIQRHDAELGQTIFKLDRALQPGQQIVLGFGIEVAQSGLTPATFPMVLRQEFSAFPVYELLPIIGFEPQLMLRDEVNRRDRGLPPRKVIPPSRLAVPGTASRLHDMVMLDSIVSTDAGHHALAQGEVLRAWQRDGRKFVHYRTRQPIRNIAAFFSIPWQPARSRIGNHVVQIFSPGPILATDQNLLGMGDTLTWLERDVAPYPGSTLSLIAIPELGPTGYALPQIVEVSHRVAFRAEPTADAGFSQIYRRAAHETAHQWFGHLLGHGNLQERAFLIESLAKYVELVMIERRYGRTAMQSLVDYEYDRYRQERIAPDHPVVPLIDADDTVDMYSRATLAFACLRGKIGDQPIVETLHALALHFEQSGQPARSIEFVDRLIAKSPQKAKEIIQRLFLGIEPVDTTLSKLGCNVPS